MLRRMRALREFMVDGVSEADWLATSPVSTWALLHLVVGVLLLQDSRACHSYWRRQTQTLPPDWL